jgi:hypothetical protein
MSKKKRFDRTAFHAIVGALDADTLRKILWNLYWRGPAALRERIEDALDPAEATRKQRTRNDVDGEDLSDDVQRFVTLARSGAYIGGTRDVSRQERTKWRVTCKRLVDDATALLQGSDFEHGAAAIEALIDLLCETQNYNYFRSEDPVAAARIVVSETVHTLWVARLQRQGFAAFARSAAPQFVRWESRFGWTRGYGPVAERETSLACVLAGMLRGQDAWEAFCDGYLEALDGIAPKPKTDGPRRARGRSRAWDSDAWERRHALERRADKLAEWHALLLERLDLHEAGRQLDRIASHPALTSPEADFMKARISRLRGDNEGARKLIESCLEQTPGHRKFIAFAQDVGATLPRRAAEIV